MKTIGIIGGMSWKSSLDYYRMINEIVKDKLGGWNSAKIIMYSVNFAEIDLEHRGKNWERSDNMLIDAAKKLEQAGADFIIIGANTAHTLYDKIQANIQIPIIHIADATAEKIRAKNIKIVGLLGTKHTMNQDFYKGRLENKYGIKVIVPNEEEKEIVHKEINNIILGNLGSDAKKQYVEIINNLAKNGAEAVILGCTEIPLIISQEDVRVLLFDTAKIHAETAVEYALK